MSSHTDEHEIDETTETEDEPQNFSTGSFLAGLVVGAAVGAGVALLLAPESGERTRRVIRRRLRHARDDVADGYHSARKEMRRLVKEKKEALRDKVKDLAESLD